MPHPKLRMCSGGFAILAAGVVASGCDGFTRAEGRVTDPDGRPLRNAHVTLRRALASKSFETDSLGRFAITMTHGGGIEHATVEACAAGYQVARREFMDTSAALRALEFQLVPAAEPARARCP